MGIADAAASATDSGSANAVTIALVTAFTGLLVALLTKIQERQNTFRQHRAEVYEQFALDAHRVGHEIAEIWRRRTMDKSAADLAVLDCWGRAEQDVFEQLDSVVSNQLRRLEIVATKTTIRAAKDLLEQLTMVRNSVHYLDVERPYDTYIRKSQGDPEQRPPATLDGASWETDVWRPFTRARDSFSQAARRDLADRTEVIWPLVVGGIIGAAATAWFLLV